VRDAAAVLAEARSWLGTAYEHGQGVKGRGVDCVFFLVRVFHAVGLIPDLDPRPYPHGPFIRDDRYVRWMLPYVDAREGSPQPADIVLFWVPPRKAPAQSSIVVAWPKVILLDQDQGVVELSALDHWTADRFHSAWTVKGIADGR
jgi:cell wall-associated NlpC family hydrolase